MSLWLPTLPGITFVHQQWTLQEGLPLLSPVMVFPLSYPMPVGMFVPHVEQYSSGNPQCLAHRSAWCLSKWRSPVWHFHRASSPFQTTSFAGALLSLVWSLDLQTSSLATAESLFEIQGLQSPPRPATSQSAFYQHPQKIHKRVKVWEILL